MAHAMNTKLRFLFFLLLATGNLFAQSISRYLPTSQAEASIEIRAAETAPFKIPRTVYGTFLEDIGNSIQGGVSAQLLDNPSLESYDASLAYLREHFSAQEFNRSSREGLPLPWLPLRVADLARCPGPRFVQQPVQTLGDESPSPLAHGLWAQSQGGAHGRVVLPLRTGQHDAGTQSQRLYRLRPPCPGLQGLLLFATQDQFRYPASSWRGVPPSYEPNTRELPSI